MCFHACAIHIATARKRQLLDKWKHVYRTRAAKNVRDGAPGSIAWFYSEYVIPSPTL